MNPALKKLLASTGAILLALSLEAQPSPHDHPAPGTGPLASVHAHLCGFHFYSGDLSRAVSVHHYCSHLRADVFQCIIYDSDRPDARLVGVEYIISEARFNQLPAEEKKLWHSHRYEVMSGQLVAPGASGPAEHELMKELVNTYGKTWQLWQVDRGDELPLGLPQLMMGFTADGQADPVMVAARDHDLHIDTAGTRARRADLPARPVAAGADAWRQKPAFQIPDPRPEPAAARPTR
ncbi:OBAP family protein [Opitutus sp. GAS368]|uniref:OBAP family protein n=1 Tax=Opitutus sp. GAS368 TaxID=1882749 RepID=UPI00087B5D63|nr:OBAP family protein [Opitutus sp. GAS368]SDS12573.1 Protein of unknown function [Opitutus sp. GAS368]